MLVNTASSREPDLSVKANRFVVHPPRGGAVVDSVDLIVSAPRDWCLWCSLIVALSPLSISQNQDRKERLRRLALETIDLAKDPYFFRNHVGQYECRLCLTIHKTGK